jgi:hypothetical protein
MECRRTARSIFRAEKKHASILGLSSLQNITATFWMLTYGVSTDATYDYVRIGESSAIES